jgi:uncharacterized protein
VRERLLVWRGLEAWLAEAALVVIDGEQLTATGTQLGAEPEPYRLDYELATAERFVTARLHVLARTAVGEHELDLRRTPDGAWTVDGQPRPDLDGALDCDLGNSPLTNTMPIRRAGAGDFAMAWVSVPDLAVHRSPQRYEPIDARSVRYVSLDGDFRADLELDEEGFVVRYPQLAERLSSEGR